MKLSGASPTTHTLTLALAVNSSASRQIADGTRGSERDTPCFYFWVFHSCTNLKQWTIWSHKTSTRPLYHMPAWCFLYHFGAFQLKLDRGVKGCEYKSSYAWQKVVSANVYDATCNFDHAREGKAAEGKGQSWLKSHPLVPVISLMPIIIWPTLWSSPPPLILHRPHPDIWLFRWPKKCKKWVGDWKVNCASMGLVLGSKRKGFYTDILSDFKRTCWLFFLDMDDINLPKRKYRKDNEEAAKRRAARGQGHEAPKGKLFFLFMWNYGRDTGNQLAASKSENLSWWRESKFVYK